MNKWLKLCIPILLVLGLVLASSCAPAAAPPMERPSTPTTSEGLDIGSYPKAVTLFGEITIDRKIVKTGNITLEVEDIAEAMDKVAGVADELGGYVVSSHKSEDGEKTSGYITIRVPADRFDVAFARLHELALAVPDESTGAQDVTEEYIDLQARLHNLEATETQYLALLEKAETVEEILKVQRELCDVRGEIEQIEGRIKYLERTSDMSLIEVTLRETKPLAEHWSASSVFTGAVRGLVTFGRGLLTALMWLGVFCWVWIPPLVIWLRRRRKKRA